MFIGSKFPELCTQAPGTNPAPPVAAPKTTGWPSCAVPRLPCPGARSVWGACGWWDQRTCSWGFAALGKLIIQVKEAKLRLILITVGYNFKLFCRLSILPFKSTNIREMMSQKHQAQIYLWSGVKSSWVYAYLQYFLTSCFQSHFHWQVMWIPKQFVFWSLYCDYMHCVKIIKTYFRCIITYTGMGLSFGGFSLPGGDLWYTALDATSNIKGIRLFFFFKEKIDYAQVRFWCITVHPRIHPGAIDLYKRSIFLSRSWWSFSLESVLRCLLMSKAEMLLTVKDWRQYCMFF